MTKKWTIEPNDRRSLSHPHILRWGGGAGWLLTDEQAAPEAWSEIVRDPLLPDTVDVLRDGTLIFTAPHHGATLDGHTLHYCGSLLSVHHFARKGGRYVARPIPEPATKKVPLDACLTQRDARFHKVIVGVDLDSQRYRVSGDYEWFAADAGGHVEVLDGCES